MKYTIKTTQYGEFKDVFHHDDIDALKHDLCNIVHMGTIVIDEILDNGKPMGPVMIRILMAQARRDSARIFNADKHCK